MEKVMTENTVIKPNVSIKVLRDFVAVQQVKKPEEHVGLIQIVRLSDRLAHGVVVAKGTGVLTQNGQAHEIEVNIGDTIVYDTHSAREVQNKGEKYSIVNELSILCVLL